MYFRTDQTSQSSVSPPTYIASSESTEAPARTAPVLKKQSLFSALRELPLFRESLWERSWAFVVAPVARICCFREAPVHSHVVPKLTLWERFLCHRSRYARRMTFTMAQSGQTAQHNEFVSRTLYALCRFVREHHTGWENQPLNVVVLDCCRMRRLDPRETTGDDFRVAIVDHTGAVRVCSFRLSVMVHLQDDELAEYVERQHGLAGPARGSVAAVVNTHAVSAEVAEGSYCQLTGAWLRISADSQTGGLVASADHLIMDGALFQQMLLSVSRHAFVPVEGLPAESSIQPQALTEPSVDAPMATLRVSKFESVCALLHHLTNTLQEFGVELHTDKDTVLLTALPHCGPDANAQIPKQRRRVTIMLLDVAAADGPEQLRQKIAKLNETSWQSASVQLWQSLYRGNVWYPVIRYFESIAPWVPFQRTSRYLSGAGLLTFLPPLTVEPVEAERMEQLSVRTLTPLMGGPTIAVSQTRCAETGQATAFITVLGSGRWNRAERLLAFRDALALRLHAAGKVTSALDAAGAQAAPAALQRPFSRQRDERVSA